jgi:hypothetical protein
MSQGTRQTYIQGLHGYHEKSNTLYACYKRLKLRPLDQIHAKCFRYGRDGFSSQVVLILG